MKKLKIGIDIDNVIADSYPVYIEKFNQAFGTKVSYDDVFNFYHLEYNAGVEKEKVDIFIDRVLHTEEFQYSIPAFEEAREIIKKWARNGFILHYISVRPITIKKVTRRWLKKHAFWVKGSRLHLYNIKKGQSDVEFKREKGEKLGLDFFIEDNREIAQALHIPVFLLDRPWNQGTLPKNVKRVKNWEEIEKYIG